MAKRKTALQREYAKEIRNLKRRMKTMEKYHAFVPYQTKQNLLRTPEKITRRDIERIKSYRGEKLYKKAEPLITTAPKPTYAQFRGYIQKRINYSRWEHKLVREFVDKNYQNWNISSKREYNIARERWQEDTRRKIREYEEAGYYDEPEIEEAEIEQPEQSITVSDVVLRNVEDIIYNFHPEAFRNKYSLMVGRYKRDICQTYLEAAISSEGREAVAYRLNQANVATDVAKIVEKGIYDSDSLESADSNDNIIKFITILSTYSLTPEDLKMLSDDYGY